jgi:hypothetical protein
MNARGPKIKAKVRQAIRRRVADGSLRVDLQAALACLEACGLGRLNDLELAAAVVNANPDLRERILRVLQMRAAARAMGDAEGYVRELFAGVAHAVEEHMEGVREREERREADRRLFRLLVKNDIAHALDLGELEDAERLRVIRQAIEEDNPLWPMWFRRVRGEEMR